ncbi:hypothetical protein ABFS82_08G158400 [Erythranthe guttata]|uniref:NAC domain-containing protein n=1 Tax=Erythranthe guttata TaxID=4155 RepID=A0A022QYZ4_ERYGU|nr:PREDICTED: NAC domain-containing protein 76-like [Erythranthe guttata]EYU33812.1 hypothetical protein MIMGU_mgv1a025187mg [Erythranthe guttata]|eukprot:XP_012841907.1 PREDICTED: NAC domain-containing protein 76-like [Erythranthe guttata]
MMAGNGQLSVPPGFRFHPTDEELLYYYLRKKVSYEPIDLDVIREVDLNKLEPWDLKEKCRIGSGPQNDWYFFSHKDKKYPTGTRTNRATTAGFWKATGRDKGIHVSNSAKRIGMRKTLVFYTGRAPHGHKTDWIMHEYRLDDDNLNTQIQEDGWVVCRVFKKKNHTRSGNFQSELDQQETVVPFGTALPGSTFDHHKQNSDQPQYNNNNNNNYTFDHHHHNQSSSSSMQLPQLLSPDTAPPPFYSSLPVDLQNSQNLLTLIPGGAGPSSGGAGGLILPEKFSGDWSFLDKLLANQQLSQVADHSVQPGQRFPFPYLGFEPDYSRYSK